MQCPQHHKKFATKDRAERAMTKLIQRAKRTGEGGKSYKRLNVFQCGDHFHIGRANKLPACYQPPAPEPKRPSVGDLRRKLERMKRKWDRQDDHRHRLRAEELGRLIAEEQAVVDMENELRQIQLEAIALLMPELLRQTNV